MNKKPSMFKYNYVVLKYVFKFCPGFIYYSILNVIASVVKTMSNVLLISEAINVVIKTQNIDYIYKLFDSFLLYLLIIVICSIITGLYDNYITPRYQLKYQNLK